MTNRLAASTSPYLQQHAQNPVHWQEWGEDAFAEARRRDVPLLVSIGYASCHWCHVMAHESFEDEGTAAYMNEHFVNVKVDREERPDVDAVFMAATQATTGQGGWPMTVFTTPDGRPFYCGTYFPPQPVGGLASFRQVLEAVADAWRTQRADLEHNAGLLGDALGSRPAVGPGQGPLSDAALEAATAAARDEVTGDYDAQNGGFGAAPKFPPSLVLEWLLRRAARAHDIVAMDMAEHTLTAMARGGMADQIGGGFARYSVDGRWTVPHFEKMLEDNALLLRVYLHWWRATGSALALDVVERTARWMTRALHTDQGAFASSLDADTDGVEGLTYVWTPAQLVEVLGEEDGTWAAEVYAVTEAGTFEHGTSVLQLRHDPGADAAERLASVRRRLLKARRARPQPARDDKVVAAWNGLAIAALAEAGAMLGHRQWVGAALRAAALLDTVHLRTEPTGPDGAPQTRLLRTSRDGVAGSAPGVLADYAHVAEGFLTLYSATDDEHWYVRAGELLETVLTRFADGEGGFFDTADDRTDPVLARLQRPQEIADGPAPSGQSAAAGALLAYSALSGFARHRQAAELALAAPLAIAPRAPRACGWALATADAMLDGPVQVAVVGRGLDPSTAELAQVAWRSTAPGHVLAVGDPERMEVVGTRVPLLEGRTLVDGLAAAYVCRGFVCDLPTTQPAQLARSLGGGATAAGAR
ncbi:thioredoxin domain-containing protein [Cellulomonas cellasea]|uniref:thioredoxin domain-containing protein n=1 Tax=Cellulomonas cellasea TaxID=43670 RepID=UPI0025A39F55|nr:thioredoxin domain-containing protein [Cellulomonas cellasea]MDM8083799.1 thioredoxin domain-containing protein [Cellulomonas cellasea]